MFGKFNELDCIADRRLVVNAGVNGPAGAETHDGPEAFRPCATAALAGDGSFDCDAVAVLGAIAELCEVVVLFDVGLIDFWFPNSSGSQPTKAWLVAFAPLPAAGPSVFQRA